MVKPVHGKHIIDRRNRASLWIQCAEYHPVNACMGNSASAHDTGLQRYIEGMPIQAVIAGRLRGSAKCHDLGMRGGITTADRLVPALGNQRTVPDDDCTD